jgi:hypothetical protein
MKRMTIGCLVSAAVVLTANAALLADVLVLRDGRRIEGVLTTIRGDTVEFEHRTGREQGRVIRYDRADVRAVEFNDVGSGGSFFRDENRYRGDARPQSGLRERAVTVDARTQWTDTGIDVRGGQQMFFAATGQVRWGPGRRDGAAGERNSPFNQGRPMPDRNAAALIGKIGPNGDPFFIGEDREAIRVRGSGRLFLGINDDFLGDNSGTLRVVVSY